MIDFTRAFDSAWERMMVILFRPFDLGKWFVIGWSAFLAGLLQGGNGFNSSFNTNSFNKDSFSKSGTIQTPHLDLHQFQTSLAQFATIQVGLIILIVIAVIIFVIALSLALYWLGARGQFLFLDNIVRNRGAISGPWGHYARQANSLFVFYLLFLLLALPVFLVILGIAAVMCIPLFLQHRWPGESEIIGFVLLGLFYLAVALVFGIVLFIFREFGVPLMFRNGLMAKAAFWQSMSLVKEHPASVVCFILIRFAIAIAVAIISIIACCFTCCIGALPYLGTVILLPALIFVRCFTLDCLAQFGPEYDVWTVDVPPAGSQPATPLGFSPPPPLG